MSYTELLDDICKLACGLPVSNNVYNHTDLLKYYLNTYSTINKNYKVEPGLKIQLFSYLFYNNNELSSQYIFLSLINKKPYIRNNLFTILSFFEKWRMYNIYDLSLECQYYVSKNVEIVSDGILYVFDLLNIYNALSSFINITPVMQMCFNDVEYIVDNTPKLVLLEDISNKCMLIRKVSNPTKTDFIICESSVNPFVIGNKILINNKQFIYGNCNSSCMYLHTIRNFQIGFKTSNNICSFVILNNYKRNKCNNNIQKLNSISFNGVNINLNSFIMNFRDTNIRINTLIRGSNMYFGPCNITSNMIINTLLFDNSRYSQRKFRKLSDEHLQYLKNMYNIPDNYNLKYNNFTTNVLIKYDKEFVRQNNFFSCLENNANELVIIGIPHWDVIDI